MRKAVLCLAPVVTTLVLFACDDTPSGGSGTGFTFDGGSFDSAVAPQPPPPPPTDGGPVDAGPGTVTVHVRRFLKDVPNITVVWHDATGAVIGTAKTDTNGMAKKSDGVPAMATALLGSPATGLHAVTWVSPQAGDMLEANDGDLSGQVVGSVNGTLNQATNPGSGTYDISLGADCTSFISATDAPPTSAFSINFREECLQGGANVALLGRFMNGSVPEQYSFKKNVAVVTDGGSVDATTDGWQAASNLVVTINNLPDAGGPINTFFSHVLNGVAYPDGLNTQPDNTGKVTFKYAPNFADSLRYGVLVVDNSSLLVARTIAKQAAPGAAGQLDYNELLPALSNLNVDTTTISRPGLTWTSPAPIAATAKGGVAQIGWFNPLADASSSWMVVVPAGATSVKFPALPADASQWAPPDPDSGTSVNIDDAQVLFADIDVASASLFRQGAALAIPAVNAYGLDVVRDASIPTAPGAPVTGKLRITRVAIPGAS